MFHNIIIRQDKVNIQFIFWTVMSSCWRWKRGNASAIFLSISNAKISKLGYKKYCIHFKRGNRFGLHVGHGPFSFRFSLIISMACTRNLFVSKLQELSSAAPVMFALKYCPWEPLKILRATSHKFGYRSIQIIFYERSKTMPCSWGPSGTRNHQPMDMANQFTCSYDVNKVVLCKKKLFHPFIAKSDTHTRCVTSIRGLYF
jgi:hypothetical protein